MTIIPVDFFLQVILLRIVNVQTKSVRVSTGVRLNILMRKLRALMISDSLPIKNTGEGYG